LNLLDERDIDRQLPDLEKFILILTNKFLYLVKWKKQINHLGWTG